MLYNQIYYSYNITKLIKVYLIAIILNFIKGMMILNSIWNYNHNNIVINCIF